MRLSVQDIQGRIDRIMRAWETICPNHTLSGLTLQQYKDAVKPSREARTKLVTIHSQQRQTIAERRAADFRSLKIVRRVILATLGDADHGPDGDLYAAMGFIPESQRRTGRTRRRATKRVKPRTAPPAAHLNRRRRSGG